ncbi:MAG: VOC family protein [Endozoicomonas sp.]|uniref:VOC family protein n=1 Tax=Endozoicomonas sp. TaxID=1892382 RepID=UPI003D9B4EEF
MQKLRFHHVGIPTREKLPDDCYNEKLKLHATGYFETPYAVEWMNFDEDNSLPDIIKTTPHIAFEVEDLEAALKGKEVVLAPRSPAKHVTVAFIKDGRTLIELIQFDRPESELWPHPEKFRI